MDLAQMREKRAKLVADARALHTKAQTEKRSLTADEQKQFAGFLEQAKTIEAELHTLEALEAQERSLGQSAGRVANPNPVMDKKDEKRYSLLRALSLQAEKKPVDGLEAEVSQEIAKRSGKSPRGIYVPWHLPFDARALGGAGRQPESRAVLVSNSGNAVATELGDLIGVLRNKMVMQAMGAFVMTGMQGNFSLPKQSATSTAYWVGENTAPTSSDPRIASQVAFTPTTVGTYTDLSRQFIEQSSVDAEMWARNDLATIVALELDRAGLNGSGTGAEPLGILQDGGIGTVALATNGQALTYGNVVSLESAVAALNADVGSLGYVTNAKVRGALKTTPKFTNTGFPIWEDGNTLAGYKTGVTNAMPSNLTKGTGTGLSSMIFGNFADQIYALWSGLDILVDPYTGSTAGTVRVVVLQDATVKRRRSESFAKCVDIIA